MIRTGPIDFHPEDVLAHLEAEFKIRERNIEDSAVTAAKIAADTIEAGDIAADTIVNAQINSAAAIVRTKLAQEDLAVFAVSLTDFRVFDALATVSPGTAANDDLGLIGGTHGTGSPVLEGVANAAASTETQSARVQVVVPAEYVDGETLTLRVHARMSEVVNTAATLDCLVYESDSEAGVSADLCATAATTINSATWADVDFTITPTAVVSGDVLDVLLTTVADDTGGSATGRAQIGAVSLLADIQG